jgi:hypothetical protein
MLGQGAPERSGGHDVADRILLAEAAGDAVNVPASLGEAYRSS